MLPPGPCPRLESNIFEGKEDATARFRTVAAGAVFLFGTTFLRFMPSFLATLVPMVAGKEIGPRVKELEPNRRMLRWDGLGEFTREWILDPLDMKAMRLLGSGAAAAGAGILTYGAWSAASWVRYGHTHPERPPARSSPPSTSRATSRSSTPSPPTRSAPTGPASSPAPGWSPPIRNPEGGSGATGRRCQPGSSSSGT
jgi:hypothetical protein